MADNEKSFEQAMDELEQIVTRLEKGDAPLEEALGYFEQGARLVAECKKRLEEAEQKVVQLRKGTNGSPEELPLD